MNKRLLFAMPIVMLAASVASAHYYIEVDQIQPYFGVDAQWRTMGFKRGFGNNLFKHNFPQGNVYAGLQFGDFVAIEAGYESSLKVHRDVNISTGEQALGLIATENEVHEANAYFHGWHVDLVGFLPIYDEYRVSLVGSVGIAGLTAKLTDIITQLGPDVGFQQYNFRQCRTLFRLGAGITQLLTDSVGFRGMVYWQNTRRFNLSNQGVGFIIKPKDSIIYSLGLFVYF